MLYFSAADASTWWPSWSNQTGCRCKAIFQILVIVLVFMLELVDKLGGKQFWNRPEFLSLPGVLRHFEGDYCLTRGQNHQGGHLGLGSLCCKKPPRRIRSVCGNPKRFSLHSGLSKSHSFDPSNGAEIVLSGRSLTFVL